MNFIKDKKVLHPGLFLLTLTHPGWMKLVFAGVPLSRHGGIKQDFSKRSPYENKY
jgi:hypothetical protein